MATKIEKVYDRQTKIFFKRLGCDLTKVQSFNTFVYRSFDLYGWQDWQGVLGKHIIGVQQTSIAKRQEHLKNYTNNPETLNKIADWIGAKGKAILICWERTQTGKRFTYKATVEDLAYLLGLSAKNWKLPGKSTTTDNCSNAD